MRHRSCLSCIIQYSARNGNERKKEILIFGGQESDIIFLQRVEESAKIVYDGKSYMAILKRKGKEELEHE